MSEVPKREDLQTVRVTTETHRDLLTIQYRRKMAGEQVSIGEIIAELLADRKPVQP